jgi:hypothetical protein
MPAEVHVTRVTVEYEVAGKSFTVEFEPGQIASIFFNEDDRRAAQEKQNERAQAGKGRAVVENEFAADQPVPAMVGTERTGAKGKQRGTAATARTAVTTAAATAVPLWWHTNGCSWFHPGV